MITFYPTNTHHHRAISMAYGIYINVSLAVLMNF